ncbi:PEPxxWA-CTERM sorting domain-containing protein [Phenylobacterium sp.]|uniref:PEPxxWA-CTERM sorting domain-containing protein n=1 Tax=Phenylobacterium sp. TaxID=1871053 RepID=UPI0035642C49
MKFLKTFAALSIACATYCTSASAASVVVDFPSPGSTINNGIPLNGGGGGFLSSSGDHLTQWALNTGLTSVTSAVWHFDMSDHVTAGIDSTFNILINDVVVGAYDFVATCVEPCGDIHHHFDVVTNFAAIAAQIAGGQDPNSFHLKLLATSSTGFGGGSWDWLPGGSVTLIGSDAVLEPPHLPGVPEPASWGLMILGFGAVGGMLRHSRGARQTVKIS